MSGGPGDESLPAAEAASSRVLGRGYQGVVYLRQTAAGPVIVKTPSGKGLAHSVRRAMLRREHAIYQRLQGIRGVPRCEGLQNGEELVLEYIAGPSLRDANLTGVVREQFFADLLKLIQAIHANGVAHGDLKRKDNILAGPGGQPFLIDFGTALSVESQSGMLRRWLFRQMVRIDLNAWVKLKYQRQWLEFDAADARLHDPTPPERLARVIRRAWRALTLRRRRRRAG